MPWSKKERSAYARGYNAGSSYQYPRELGEGFWSPSAAWGQEVTAALQAAHDFIDTLVAGGSFFIDDDGEGKRAEAVLCKTEAAMVRLEQEFIDAIQRERERAG